MTILIACEYSQALTTELRALGHSAYSCDILPTTGPHPEYHLQTNVIPLLSQPWDMIIAFPPCTHLCASGARWFKRKRADGRQAKAINFFLAFTALQCPRVAIENPIGIMSTLYQPPTQIVHPWQHGHGETKATCLWLKNLPPLLPTQTVPGRAPRIHRLPPGPDRSRIRSLTYPGIARAMALQWTLPP